LITTLVSEKKRQFFAENLQKSPKIVMITSTPEVRRVKINFLVAKHQLFGALQKRKLENKLEVALNITRAAAVQLKKKKNLSFFFCFDKIATQSEIYRIQRKIVLNK
jgi:hypothetical protein